MAPILTPFWRARARGAPRTPFTLRNFSREIFFSLKWPVQVKPLKKQNLCWTGHFIPPPPTENASIKWPVQHRFCFFRGFTWTGHFIEAFSVGGGGIKWPVQHRFCFFRGFTWTGHFIEAFSVWGGGIKWPVQHRFCFFRGFTWTGHFIEKKISLERGPQGEWGPGQLYKVIWVMYLMTL